MIYGNLSSSVCQRLTDSQLETIGKLAKCLKMRQTCSIAYTHLPLDQGTGVMRHADTGYEGAVACATEMGLKLPMTLG